MPEQSKRPWRDRLRAALLYGSPLLAAAITVSLSVMKQHDMLAFNPSYRQLGAFAWVNWGLAVVGSGAGALLTPVSAAERFARAVWFGLLSAAVYFVALAIGTLLFVRLDI